MTLPNWRSSALALVLFGAACAPREPDYAARFPGAPIELATRIVAMNCSELALTELALNLIERFGPLARAGIETSGLPGEDRALLLSLIDTAEDTRGQVSGLTNLMQTVRACG
ncbi:MAG: hypothetical protein ACPGID_13850 [Rubricella sp.]